MAAVAGFLLPQDDRVDECYNCGSSGALWTKGARFAKPLCHSCGLYSSVHARPRPVQFGAE